MKTKNNQSFTLEEEYIELNKLLKFMGVAESGAHAKQLVDEGLVKLNGKPESRRRAKCRNGDVVEVAEMTKRIE